MNHPLPAFHFKVDWAGTRIGFTEVSGLEFEADVIEYREGSSPVSSSMKIPGVKKYGDITLKRGIFLGDNEYSDWYETIKMGTVERRDVTISMLNEDHEPVVIWKVVNAWPRKISGPLLHAQSSSVAIEELVITCDEIIVENG